MDFFFFLECKFVSVEGREVLSGNIANVSIKDKAKFPQEFFPDVINAFIVLALDIYIADFKNFSWIENERFFQCDISFPMLNMCKIMLHQVTNKIKIFVIVSMWDWS